MEEIKSTVEHLQDLIDAREDMKTSINNKGVQVSGGLKSYADAIDRIPQNVIDGDDLNVGDINVEYTKNGSYNINPTDYELDALSGVGVNVNVPTKKVGMNATPIEITKNGMGLYKAKDYSKFDGLSQVMINVNVPTKTVGAPPLPILITNNGSKTIDASDYNVDGLSQVELEINVPQSGGDDLNVGDINVEYTDNGSYNINPTDYELDALSGVDVTVNVPTKTVGAPPLPILITNNGSKTIDASDYNVDGLSRVELEINVPQSGGGVSSDIDFTQVGWTQEESDKMNAVESNFITNAMEYTNTIGFYSDYMNWTLMGYVDAYGNTQPQRRKNPFLNDRKLVIAPVVYNLCEDYPFGPKLGATFDYQYGLFANCESLRYVPQMDFGRMTTLQYMFYNCSSLISVPELNVDINNKYNMTHTFYNCSSLISVPELNFEITGATSMFENCCNLHNIYKLNLKGDTLSMMDMFDNCKSLSSVDIELNESNSSKYKSYDCRNMFYGCKNLSTVNFVINKERDSNVMDNISATNMFNGCENLSSIAPFHSGFYLTSCAGMFENCSSLKESPMLLLNQDVTDSSYMFANCHSLEKLNWIDTTYVKNTSYMFKNCSSLKEIGSSNKWVIPLDKCTDASHMFDGCSSLTYIHELKAGELNSATGMFDGCSSLVNIGPMLGLHTSVDFSSCVNLSFDSFDDFVDNVADVRDYTTSKEITISSECVQRWKAEGHESRFNYCVRRLTGIGWTLSY